MAEPDNLERDNLERDNHRDGGGGLEPSTLAARADDLATLATWPDVATSG